MTAEPRVQPSDSRQASTREAELRITPGDRRRLPDRPLQVHIGWHAIAELAAALFLGLGLLAVVWYLARPLALLFLGFAIAAALSGIVAWLAQRMPRYVAAIGLYLALLAALVGFAALVAPALVDQVQQVNQMLPDTIDSVSQRLNQMGFQDLLPFLNNAMSSVGGISSQLLTLPMAVTDVLLNILVVFFFSLYGLMVAPRVRDFIKSLVADSRQDETDHLLDELVEATGGYVRGITITGFFVSVLTYIGLRLIGVPYPLVLAVLAGLLEAIPVLGTALSLIIITAFALTQSLVTGLLTFGCMSGIQIVEGNILFPNIVGRQTHSSPLLSMFAFFAGLSVGGIVGGIIGVPLAAALRVLVVEVFAPAVRRWTRPEDMPTSSAAESAYADD